MDLEVKIERKYAYPDRQPGKLILAETDEFTGLALDHFLNGIGYDMCGVAKTGPEAVELARVHLPDLALIDVRLAHDTCGLAAAREMTERYRVAVILMTGNLNRWQAEAAGVLGLLTKPVSPAELAQTIDAALLWLGRGVVYPPVPPGLILPETISTNA